ncbi:hypothetical protein GCM10020219_096100 [Nonomuraea dietziae]
MRGRPAPSPATSGAKLGRALNVGGVAVAVMAFLAVVREGLETSLLFYASAQGAAPPRRCR